MLILVGKIIVSHTPRVGLMSLLGRASIVLLFYLSHAGKSVPINGTVKFTFKKYTKLTMEVIMA